MNFKWLKYAIRVLMIAFLCQSATAQTPIDSLAEQLMEHIAGSLPENEAAEFDISDITASLAGYLRRPLDLNRAGAEELHSLFMLNDLQISALLDHIRVTGPLVDILELQSVRHFDLPLVRRLLPFVRVGGSTPVSSFSPGDLLRRPEQELLLYYSRVLARQKGYTSTTASRLRGRPERLNLRYRFRQGNHFRLHLLAEKDPGEPLSKEHAKGFDFYSGNIFIRPQYGPVKKILIGDYLLHFGQGLNLWNGFSLGKGPAALNIGRQSQGIKPHNSSGEGYFFRGIAGTFSAGKTEFTPFFSSRKLDATPAEYDGEAGVSAIRRSGLHRNQGELAAKKTLGEKLMGLNLKYKFSKQFSLGVTGHVLSFDKPLLPGDDLYERYEFSGDRAGVLSIDYTFGRSNYFLFGEIARSRSAEWHGAPAVGGWAFIQGVLFSPARGLVLAAAIRNYGKTYQSLYASPLSESSNLSGEKGMYLGLESRFAPAWTLTAYADAFSWSWLRYRVDAPSEGYELSAQLTFRPDKKLTLYSRYRKTSKPRNREVQGNNLRRALTGIQETARIHAEYQFSRRLRLRTRIDYSSYQPGQSQQQAGQSQLQAGQSQQQAARVQAKQAGFSMFQDLYWAPGKISFNARFTWFSTDSYDSRIYSYESSLLSGASLAFFYDKGFKTYFGIRWKPGKSLDIRLRGGLLGYAHRQRIGSGPEEINGKQKPDIRMQVRFNF